MRLKMLVAASALVLPASLIAQTTTDSVPAADPAPTASADAAGTAQAGAVTLATKDDIKAGAAVLDQTGGQVGTVESLTAAGAVVSTGKVRAEIPFGSFAKSDKGLVIAMTKSQLEAQAGGNKGS